MSEEKPFVNVLLLGEYGVGKSTFINSFANYIKHNTLSEALQGEPENCAPAKIQITDGEGNLKVLTVGNYKPSNGPNETQEVTDYVFDTKDAKLRLIDTPGLTDDNIKNINTIKTILCKTAKYRYINAIAFVVKWSQKLLKSFIEHLLPHFDKTASENVIFIFTHSKATTLYENVIQEIPCLDYNTFHFDNRCFKYLVLNSRGLKTRGFESNLEYHEKIWRESLISCKNLIGYIIGSDKSTGLKPLFIKPIKDDDLNKFHKFLAYATCKIHNYNHDDDDDDDDFTDLEFNTVLDSLVTVGIYKIQKFKLTKDPFVLYLENIHSEYKDDLKILYYKRRVLKEANKIKLKDIGECIKKLKQLECIRDTITDVFGEDFNLEMEIKIESQIKSNQRQSFIGKELSTQSQSDKTEELINEVKMLKQQHCKFLEQQKERDSREKLIHQRIDDLNQNIKDIKESIQELSCEIKDMKEQLISEESTIEEADDAMMHDASNEEQPNKFQKLIDDINNLKKFKEMQTCGSEVDTKQQNIGTSDSVNQGEEPKFQNLIDGLDHSKKSKEHDGENSEVINEVKRLNGQQENISRQLEDLKSFIRETLGNKANQKM